MEYMESKMQDKYDNLEAEVEQLDPFINDLLLIAKKHNICNEQLAFVNSLFEKNYMPELVQI